MIRIGDSFKLAYTKIRTRKIRLFVTVFVASLLFAGLAAGSMIFSGMMRSMESFSDEGFSKRYIIAGGFTDSDQFSSNPYSDPGLIARAETLYKADQDKRKAVAKRLGIEYQENESDKTVMTNPDGSKNLNTMTPVGQQVIAEQAATQTDINTMDAFKKQLGTEANKYYEAHRMSSQGMRYNSPQLIPILDGEEKYSLEGRQYLPPGYTQGISGITDSWTLMDGELIKPFLLKGQTLERGSDGSIPIVISYSAAQEILKAAKLDAKATLQQKKQRLSNTRRDIAGKTFEICYRNAASYQALQQAASQQADLKQNGTKKEYQKPDLLYGLPESPCTEPVVQRDVRPGETKAYDKKLLQFNQEMGVQQPSSQRLLFRVVGVSPDRTMTGMAMPTIEDILGMMTQSTLGSSWVSPMSAKETSPAVQDVFMMTTGPSYEPQRYFLAEYASDTTAREVLKNQNCVMQYPGMPLEPGQVACSRKTRPFMLQAFGSASLALTEAKAGFRKAQLIAAGVVAVLASVILMGMVGRIIADARKETAVFRAVGASRLAVTQIYITYTLYLVLLILLLALIIGFGVAFYVDRQFGPNTSITMALLFNVADLGKQFYYYALDWYDVGLIGAVVAAASLTGAIVPIAHNIQRNPITDMRDE